MARSQTAQEVADQRVNAVINPQLEAIQRAQAEADARAAAAWQRQQEAIAGYSQAAAQMLQGTGQQVQQGYADAGQRTANYAKGFSIGFNSAVSGNADEANRLLAMNGSGQTVQSAGSPGADVIYGLGGFIPASSLEREGAAFGAAASMLPSTQLGYGSQRLAQGQQQFATDAEARRQQYEDMRRDVLGTRGQLTSQELQRIRENNRAKLAFAEQKRAARANERIQQESVDRQADYLENTLRATGASITGIDPLTGLPTASTQRTLTAAQQKRQAARQKAVAKKNDQTVSAIADATDWVESQLKPGSRQVQSGAVPVKAYTRKVGKTTVQYYAKKGGGYTTDPDKAATKPVYETQPIPKTQYTRLRRQLVSRLNGQLRRFGYKPAAISSMADEILNDYYSYEEKYGKQVRGESAGDKVPPRG